MARQSPTDKLARLITVTEAWESLSPNRTFYSHTLAQFKQAIQPSFDTRAEIADLQRRLRIVIAARDRADVRSFRLLQGVVFGVLGHPDEGALYAAMGYVRRGARRARRRKKTVSAVRRETRRRRAG